MQLQMRCTAPRCRGTHAAALPTARVCAAPRRHRTAARANSGSDSVGGSDASGSEADVIDVNALDAADAAADATVGSDFRLDGGSADETGGRSKDGFGGTDDDDGGSALEDDGDRGEGEDEDEDEDEDGGEPAYVMNHLVGEYTSTGRKVQDIPRVEDRQNNNPHAHYRHVPGQKKVSLMLGTQLIAAEEDGFKPIMDNTKEAQEQLMSKVGEVHPLACCVIACCVHCMQFPAYSVGFIDRCRGGSTCQHQLYPI